MDQQQQIEPSIIYPTGYISLRLTMKHEDWPLIAREVINDSEWYISYPHYGKNRDNEHFHVFLPGGRTESEKYRNRAKKLGYSGNKHVSIKCHENGLSCAIQYGSRENTEPFAKGDNVQEWIENAPKWVQVDKASMLGKRGRVDPEGIKLTSVNHLRLAWEYRKKQRFPNDTLPGVIASMLDAGYYICPAFARQGVPDFYKDVFADSVKCGRLQWKSQIKQWSMHLWRPISRSF